jgi:hypothetical protein
MLRGDADIYLSLSGSVTSYVKAIGGF